MKELIGKVVSTKMKNTVVVSVARHKLHPLYKKYLTRSKRLKAHVSEIEVKEGDWVKIVSTKPLSKDKYYKVIGKVKQ